MNSVERVFSAALGNPVDRVPVTATLSLYGSLLTKISTKTLYSDSVAYAESQLAVLERFKPDAILSPFEISVLAVPFGAECIYYDNYAPNLSRYSTRDLTSCQFPEFDHPVFQYLFESIRLMRKNAPEGTVIGGILLAPNEYASMIMGMEAWIEALILYPDRAAAIMKRLADFTVELGNIMLESGATELIIPVSCSNYRIVTKGMFLKQIKPYLTMVLNGFQGPVVIHSSGSQLIEELTDLDTIVGFYLEYCDSFEKVRTTVPNHLLIGNIDGPLLCHKTPEQVYSMVKKLMEKQKSDPYFMLATGGADIPLNTPIETVSAFFEAAGSIGGNV